ncbi:hypothetical protein GCM10010306_088000 [Streptomyces umbrinus]|nr:hypothetical protein GCM10010306_088000 [Streptomyces umbrinus]
MLEEGQLSPRLQDSANFGQHTVEIFHHAQKQKGDGGVEFFILEGETFASRIDDFDRWCRAVYFPHQLRAHPGGRFDGNDVVSLAVVRKITSGARTYFHHPTGQITHESGAQLGPTDTSFKSFRNAIVLPGEHLRYATVSHAWRL